MALSTAGYAFFSIESADDFADKVKYNNLVFQRQGELWQTEISGYKFNFFYTPDKTRELAIRKRLNDYIGKPLYFINETIAEQEIWRALASFVQRVQLACLQGMNCTGDLPEKTCSDNVILIYENFTSNILEDENCIFIFSNDTLRDADAFLFRILGVK